MNSLQDPSPTPHSRAETRVEAFTATVLHNAVHEAIANDDQLAAQCETLAELAHREAEREDDAGHDEFADEIGHAYDSLLFVVDRRSFEVTAEACATVIRDGRQWVTDGHYSADEVREARRQARRWLHGRDELIARVGAADVVGRCFEERGSA